MREGWGAITTFKVSVYYTFSKQTEASILRISHISFYTPFKGAFTPNVKSVLSENLGGILGGTKF
jgi:hypothetical protein